MAVQVHIVFLYHPAADSRTSSLPDAIIKRVESLYQADNCNTLVAQIRYGCLPSTARTTTSAEKKITFECFLSSSSSLSLSPLMTSADYWKQQNSTGKDVIPSMLMHVVEDIKLPRIATMHESLDQMMNSEAESKLYQGCLADGLVAALELFTCATPPTIPILARYLVHILPDTPPLDMDDRSYPHSNLDSTHDRWSWIRAAQELGKMAVWPCTHVLPLTPGGTSSSLTPECEKVHECILDEMPSAFPSTSDPPSILGGLYTGTSNAHSLLLCGLGEPAAVAARSLSSAGTVSNSVTKKRSRKASIGVKPVKDKTREEDDKNILAVNTIPMADAASKGERQGTSQGRGEIDKIAINKIVFLQQQQQLMMRNLAVAARQQQTKEHDQDWSARQRLLEQFRDQMIAQQTALKAQAATLHAGGFVPDLSNSLTTLMAIDKEARDRGLNLGGPSGMQQAMVQRQKQLMHVQQQQQQQQQLLQNKQQQPSTSTPVTLNKPVSGTTGPEISAAAVSSAANVSQSGPQSSSTGGPQPFWNGAIMWTVAMPNNKRNQAVTFVSAHCAPNTSKDNLMLPWQQRLNITEVQSITLSALQSYAAKNSTPCILFQPLNVPMPNRPSSSGGGVVSPAPQQTNEAMYLMLAKMIDSKKSCAFIPLQGINCTPEAGIIIVPTSTQAGSNNRRILGLIFRQSVPWNLFAAPPAVIGQIQGNVTQQPLGQPKQSPLVPPSFATPTNNMNVGPANSVSAILASSNAQPQQAALFQPQHQMSQTNSSSHASASLNSQLPNWAQPNAATSYSINPQLPQSAASTSSFPPVQLQSMPIAPAANNRMDFDLQTLSDQFNFNASQPPPLQQSLPQQQQQQPIPSFNPAMLNQLFAMQGSDTSQQASISQPAPLDLEALQRLLGLNTS